ncbi:MAG: hypothetical protein KC777_06585 [Cyanobacteria bacterium HKST-UBA02]|nr:hypothetical protein [Cyanobacteria bacterium HKST-UBA02]
MKYIGLAILIAGAFLWCGNVFGFFRTFPLCGYLVMALGGFLMKQGGGGGGEG